MIKYGIYDENDSIVGEYENLDDGLAALRALGDGEITPYRCGGNGYFTQHYHLERGLYSRICRGKSTLHFRDGAPIQPISAEELAFIQSYLPADELEELLVTLNTEKAKSLFHRLEPAPLVWDPKMRTMTFDFYFWETEDTDEGDAVLYYKCPPFSG